MILAMEVITSRDTAALITHQSRTDKIQILTNSAPVGSSIVVTALP